METLQTDIDTCILQLFIKFFVKPIHRHYNHTFNKSRKSFVGKIWEAKSAVPGGEGPQKSWGNKIRVRVKAPAVMDLESHADRASPHMKRPRDAKIRTGVRAPAVMDFALLRWCVLHRGEVWPYGHHFLPRLLYLTNNSLVYTLPDKSHYYDKLFTV